MLTLLIIRPYKATTESLDNMLGPFLTVRTCCVFVIINCLSPDSVRGFKHIVLERRQTSGFCKLTSCWRVCDCGASSFMWQQHPPPRPRTHTLPHTRAQVLEGVLRSSRGERRSHMLRLAPLLSSCQLLSKIRFYKIRLADAAVCVLRCPNCVLEQPSWPHFWC